MKKILVACVSFIILIIIMILLVFEFKTETIIKDNNKLQIIATLFPQYDFAKQIVGDKADVKLLINSGVETHNYEPTAKEMITILNNTDIFLFTGTQLEPWTENLTKNLKDTNCEIADISKGIDLIKVEEFEEKYMNSEILSEEENSHHEEEIYDGHIWLSPQNAIKMLDNTLEIICKIDVENQEYYRKNADKYKEKILELDSELRQIVKESNRKEIAVGGEFAYSYLIDEYGLKFVTVYTNCGHGEDPSISKVKSVIDYINKYSVPVVYYEELSEGTVAKMIAEETKSKALILYSIHNANTAEDTYVSLMRKNLENLKAGLN